MIPSKLLYFIAIFSLTILIAGCSSSNSILPTALTASSGGDFEGVITMQMNAGTINNQLLYTIKGHKQRLDFPMTIAGRKINNFVIMDTNTGNMTMMMEMNKSYTVSNMKDVGKFAAKHGGKPPTIKSTGESETIAGMSCEHYVTDVNPKTDMCVAKNFVSYADMGKFFPGTVVPDDLKTGAFPLKVITTDNGKTTMTMQVTSIERKQVADSLFAIPAGYKKSAMPVFPGN